MKNRVRVISEIESLRCQSHGIERRVAIETVFRDINAQPADRFNRNKLGWIVTAVLLLPIPILFIKNTMSDSSEGWSTLVLFAWLNVGIFLVALMWHKLPSKLNHGPAAIESKCCSCRYDLDGHESVLGDDIWVGPETCPECGQKYPAIG